MHENPTLSTFRQHPRLSVLRLLAKGCLGILLIASCSDIVMDTATLLASVSVTIAKPTLGVGETTQASVTLLDALKKPVTGYAGYAITWISSNPSIATVGATGVVSAISAGSTTITATSSGQSGSASVTVTAAPPAATASVIVALATQMITVGATTQATVTNKDVSGGVLTGRVVTWASSNAAVATVSGTGAVSAVSPGTTTITATSEGQSGSATLTVTAPPPAATASVAVALAAPTLTVGGTTQATATNKDSSGNVLTGRVVTWASGNAAVATVSGTGVVRAVSAGTTTIMATSEGQNGSATLTVTAPPPAATASVMVALAAPSLREGGITQATATNKDASGNVLTGRVVTWASGDAAVATVSGTGEVNAMSAGTATIVATSEGQNGSATLTVTVTAPPPGATASVMVALAAPTLTVGGTTQATATNKDASGNVLTGRVVTWASGNAAVATVSGTGAVRAVSAGTTTIMATSEGQSGTATLRVTPPAPEPAAGDIILLQDSFERANPAAGYATRGTIVSVAGHAGLGIRFQYSAASPDNLIETTFAPSTDTYFRYWYKTSPGADPTCGNLNRPGFKWFMPWRSVDPRYTMGVGNLSGSPAGPAGSATNAGLEFASHDNSSTGMPNPFLQNVTKAIRFGTTNDGAWHKYTLHVLNGNGGYEQIWVDGTLILDSSAYSYDHSSEGISLIQFPGLVVNFTGCTNFTVDVDDLVVWHR